MTVKTVEIAKAPDHLIYEMDEGQPIYYKGYKQYLNLNGSEQNEETMPDSSLQAFLKGQIFALLNALLYGPTNFIVTVGEQGLSLKKNVWRAADIAVFDKANFQPTINYAKNPPDVVIEIDIKGHYDSEDKMIKDFHRKNAQLLNFGVKKIIWVFTGTKSIMSLTKKGEEHFGWPDDIPVVDDVSFNVEKIDKELREILKK